MADIHPVIADATEYMLDISLIIREPLGIQKVRAFDRFGIDIINREMGCERNAIVSTGLFLRGRCPFQVEVTACESGIITLTGPLFSGDPHADVPMPCDALLCIENHECTGAQNNLVRQRNLLIRMCEILRSYQHRLRELQLLMSIFYALGAFFLALAITCAFIPYYGWALGLAFGALAGAALGLATSYSIWHYKISKMFEIQVREMAEARIRFDDIVSEIQANCCNSCITVDLIQPSCPI